MEVLKASKHQFPFLTGIGIGPLRERPEDVLIYKLVDPQKPNNKIFTTLIVVIQHQILHEITK